MPSKPLSRGLCAFCGREMSRSGLSRHLQTCDKRQAAIAAADSKPGHTGTLYHLQVLGTIPWHSPLSGQDPGAYWLHLEIRGNATLEDLDSYLRGIWLECCGHLSSFEIGHVEYTEGYEPDLAWHETRSMKARVDRIFQPGLEFGHEYDFGTTSEQRLKVVGERRGKPLTRHPIVLMGRNLTPTFPCMKCDGPATHICFECVSEHELTGLLCAVHARRHPHQEYGAPTALVNSPRNGLCGYTGPAEVPY
jgi:hypothetical protein